MMFRKQIEFLDSFDQLIERAFRVTIDQHNLLLRSMLVEQQLYDKGIDGNGKSLGSYTRQTIRIKVAKGQPTDRITLKDSGDFHASIEITATQQYFVISSNVGYDKWILRRYSRNTLKITNENLKDFLQRYFIPNLKKYVNELTR